MQKACQIKFALKAKARENVYSCDNLLSYIAWHRCKGHEIILINSSRRQMSLYHFRQFVKTIISDLGYADFSKWFIGHSDSTYLKKDLIDTSNS